jgi:hypothetical protein
MSYLTPSSAAGKSNKSVRVSECMDGPEVVAFEWGKSARTSSSDILNRPGIVGGSFS